MPLYTACRCGRHTHYIVSLVTPTVSSNKARGQWEIRCDCKSSRRGCFYINKCLGNDIAARGQKQRDGAPTRVPAIMLTTSSCAPTATPIEHQENRKIVESGTISDFFFKKKRQENVVATIQASTSSVLTFDWCLSSTGAFNLTKRISK